MRITKGDDESPEVNAASPARDAESPAGDLLASPNFGICDTTLTLKKNRCSRIPAKISSRTFGNSFVDFGNPKLVFEGKKRLPSVSETL
jgi:hypothetical protein